MKGKKKPYDKREAKINPWYASKMSKNIKANEIGQIGRIKAEIKEMDKLTNSFIKWF